MYKNISRRIFFDVANLVTKLGSLISHILVKNIKIVRQLINLGTVFK